jgi:hypothetical protein
MYDASDDEQWLNVPNVEGKSPSLARLGRWQDDRTELAKG